MKSQARIDTLPNDVDKKAFNLRLRNKEKELGSSSFRMKEFSTIDRLNNMYEDSTRVMDCELTRCNSPKKRLSLPQASRNYNKQLEKQTKSAIIVDPELLKKEKDKLLKRMIMHHRKENELDTE
jgi:hypothetical protein